MKRFIFIFIISFISNINAYVPPFRYWHCINFMKEIDISKPYYFNVGELHFKTSFNKSIPNTIIKNMKNNVFGSTIIYDDKLWWSYNPIIKHPPRTPFKTNKDFETTSFMINTNTNFKNCILNLFDINNLHDIYENMIGNIPQKNGHKYTNFSNGLTLVHKYELKNRIRLFQKNWRDIEIFQTFNYPYNSNIIVYLDKNDIVVININLLPVYINETKVFVTIKHNFWKSYLYKQNINYIIKFCLNRMEKQQGIITNNEEYSNHITEMYKRYNESFIK